MIYLSCDLSFFKDAGTSGNVACGLKKEESALKINCLSIVKMIAMNERSHNYESVQS